MSNLTSWSSESIEVINILLNTKNILKKNDKPGVKKVYQSL